MYIVSPLIDDIINGQPVSDFTVAAELTISIPRRVCQPYNEEKKEKIDQGKHYTKCVYSGTSFIKTLRNKDSDTCLYNHQGHLLDGVLKVALVYKATY